MGNVCCKHGQRITKLPLAKRHAGKICFWKQELKFLLLWLIRFLNIARTPPASQWKPSEAAARRLWIGSSVQSSFHTIFFSPSSVRRLNNIFSRRRLTLTMSWFCGSHSFQGSPQYLVSLPGFSYRNIGWHFVLFSRVRR